MRKAFAIAALSTAACLAGYAEEQHCLELSRIGKVAKTGKDIYPRMKRTTQHSDP